MMSRLAVSLVILAVPLPYAVIDVGTNRLRAFGNSTGKRTASAVHDGYLAVAITPLRNPKVPEARTVVVDKDASLLEASVRKPFTWVSNSQLQRLRRVSDMDAVTRRAPAAAPNRKVPADTHWKKNAAAAIEDAATYVNHDAAAATTRLSNFQDIEYLGWMGVGSMVGAECGKANGTSVLEGGEDACTLREQSNLNVVFDTGSTNLWMASDLCDQAPCNDKGRNRYDHRKSVTFHKPEDDVSVDIQFGTGELKGVQGIDDFHIGPFVVKQQVFNMIEEELGSTFRDVPLEGIVGLAFPSMHASDDLAFFDSVIQQKVLKHNEFAFYFNSDPKGSNAILWGGVDPNLYEGKIRMFPVTQAHYWAIDLHEFRIGDEVHEVTADHDDRSKFLQLLEPRKTPKLIVDSGTTYFSADGKLFDTLMEKFPQANCEETDKYPNIVFKLKDAAGHFYELSVSPREFMVSADESQCFGAFMKVGIPSEYGPAMLLGETFMRNYFTVFDRGDGSDGDARVGIARAKHGPKVNQKLLELGHERRPRH